MNTTQENVESLVPCPCLCHTSPDPDIRADAYLCDECDGSGFNPTPANVDSPT